MTFLLLIAAIFMTDKKIKQKVENELEENHNKEIFGGKILLTKFHNRGAILGIGRGYRFLVKTIAVFLTVAVTVFFLLTLGHKGNRFLKSGLALLLGGAFSNTYDRMTKGYVVDYFRINVPFKPLKNIIFNISDFCILIGSLMIALKTI